MKYLGLKGLMTPRVTQNKKHDRKMIGGEQL